MNRNGKLVILVASLVLLAVIPLADAQMPNGGLKAKITQIMEQVEQSIIDITAIQSNVTAIQSDITQIQSDLTVETGCVQATGTITLSNVVEGDTVTINGIAFTAADVPIGNEWMVGFDDVSSAAELSAAINANGNTGVIATSTANVVTLEAIEPGTVGNTITLSETGVGMVLSGVTLTGGVDCQEIKLKDKAIQNMEDIEAIKALLNLP